MSLRTNPDRILDNIDRQRSREENDPSTLDDRQAMGRELDSEVPDSDATNPERTRRIFGLVERGYMKAAHSSELGKLASRFQSIGDLHHHHARGDVSVSIQYLDSPRRDDVGMSPFEVHPEHILEAKKETKTSRPDVNAMKVLRLELRNGVQAAHKKIEPRIRDAVRERADLGHVSVQIVMDLRPAE